MAGQLSDADAWLDHLPAAVGEDAFGVEDEGLTTEEGSALLAARGSNADTDVLQVSIINAGPFSKRGSYRCGCAAAGCAPRPLKTAVVVLCSLNP